MARVEDMIATAEARIDAGDYLGAVPILEEASRLHPGHSEVSLLLGLSLNEAGRPVDAEAALRKGIEAAPWSAELHANLGVVLSAQRRDPEAEASFREALRLKPTLTPAYYNFAKALKAQSKLDEAIGALREAIRRDPQFAVAHFDLANGLLDQGRGREAIESYRTALSLDPQDHTTQTNYLMALNYIAVDPAVVVAEHKAFGDSLIARAGRPRAYANTRNPDRLLRIGILSADLRQHSCSYFLEPLLANLDRSKFEITCYYNYHQDDVVTERLRAHGPRWRSVWKMPQPQADAMIRADQIDVLIECSGLTDLSRLDIMAGKPAPVQGTYLGYPNTTGLSTIDFRVVDSISDPPSQPGVPGGSDSYCVERLARIDPCAWCYRPERDAPEVSPVPFRQNGYITFGSFNNLAKFSHAAVDLWARVLNRVPGSRLLLKNRWIGDAATAHRVRERFKACGVDPQRIEVAPYTKGVRDHLAIYGRIDLQLDTFPYHGTTTTCESFWQGVPVVALTGGVHAARVSSSLLNAVGLPELAPDSPKGFVDAAVGLAQDPDRLSGIRAGLRDMMERSPLRDETAFARRFGAMLSAEFARWCGSRA